MLPGKQRRPGVGTSCARFSGLRETRVDMELGPQSTPFQSHRIRVASVTESQRGILSPGFR